VRKTTLLFENLERFQIATVRVFLACFCLLCCCGCSMYYQPIDTFPVEPIKEFTSSASVTLINGQPSTEKIVFAGQRYADRNKWTDVAMTIAERELRKRGLNVVKGAPKSLTMSIESVKKDTGFVMIRTEILMRVTTSDGYSAVYSGSDKSAVAGRPLYQMDKNMMRVVVEMLNDPQIVAFLTK
jgi:hypothetical protein